MFVGELKAYFQISHSITPTLFLSFLFFLFSLFVCLFYIKMEDESIEELVSLAIQLEEKGQIKVDITNIQI